MMRYLFHFICYYVAWFTSILFAKDGHPWGGPIVVTALLCLQIIYLYKKTLKLIIPFTITLITTGFIIDSIFVYTHYIQLVANPFHPLSAPWMIGLWLNFSIIFYDCCHQYFKHYFILGLLACLGFPAAYYAGVLLKAASLPAGDLAIILLGVTWGVILPIICYVFYKLEMTHADYTS